MDMEDSRTKRWKVLESLMTSLRCPNLRLIVKRRIHFLLLKTSELGPWLVVFSGLSTSLRTKGLPVRFPVRAHA